MVYIDQQISACGLLFLMTKGDLHLAACYQHFVFSNFIIRRSIITLKKEPCTIFYFQLGFYIFCFMDLK